MPTIERHLERECPKHKTPRDHVAAHLPCILGAIKRLERGGSYTSGELHVLTVIAQHTIGFIDSLPRSKATQFVDEHGKFTDFLATIAQPALAA